MNKIQLINKTPICALKSLFHRNNYKYKNKKSNINSNKQINLDKFNLNGKYCETTMIGCLLRHIGINLSEPMIFGIG